MDIEYEKKREAAYWRERYNILNAANVRLTRQTYNEVERAFELAQRDIQRDIDAWLNRFADNNGVTLVEARRLLNSDELKELKWDVAEYIKRGKENAISGKWAKELENASARLHISRLEALKIRTQNHLETAFAAENKAVENLVKNVYKSNYYHTAFELQKGFGVGFDISGIDERQLDTLIKKPWTVDRRTFSDRIWERKDKMVSALHQEMIRNCIYGRSRKEMTKDMMQFVGKDIKNAEYCAARLVKTECAFFTSESQFQGLLDLDCEMYEVYLPLSPKSCEICREMNGKHFKMSEYEPGMTAPPFHPNCENGSVIPYYEDGFFDDIKGGEKISEDMTYPDWEEKFVKNDLTKADDGDIIKKTPRKRFADFVDNHPEFTDDFRNKLKVAFANGTPAAREAYIKYLTPDAIGGTAYTRNCFRPGEGKVYLNVQSLMTDPRGATTSFFHEFGHLVDYKSQKGESWASIVNPNFVKAIHKDFDDLIQNFMKVNNYSEETAFAHFRSEINKDAHLYNQISDLFGGLSQNKCRGIYKHDTEYWIDDSLAQEAFAHMFECQFDKARYNLMQHYFPTALAEFEKILGGIT